MNYLLITADQWRGDCLSVAGHPVVRTPNLDQLASEAVRFDRHYANAAPCSPARACLYTGLYQMNNRVCMNGSPLSSRHDTLALAFRRLGYNPTLFGYTDQSADPAQLSPQDPNLTSYEGLLPGFDWRVKMSDDQKVWLSWLTTQGYPDALSAPLANFHVPPDGVDDPPAGKAPVYAAEHTETAFLVTEFERWLSEQQSNKADGRGGPGWFAHLSFIRPHPPFAVPEPFNTMYRAEQVPLFHGFGQWQEEAAQHPLLEFLFGNIAKSSFIANAEGLAREWSQQDLRAIAAIYYGLVSEVDHQLGRLMHMLKESGEWQNTVIVFTSDHGEQLGDHGLLGKYGFYDQSYHIPLIVRVPGNEDRHGYTVDRFTEAVDIFPTLLQLAGAEVPVHLDGLSLTPWLCGTPVEKWRDAVHWEYDFRDVAGLGAEHYFNLPSQFCNMSVHRDQDYKYVHFAGLEPLLFDLQSDPQENINLVNDPAKLGVRVDYAERLLRWRASHLDQSLALVALTPQGVVKANESGLS